MKALPVHNFIASNLFALAKQEYNHDGRGSMPIRRDAFDMASVMFSPTSDGVPLDGVPEPVMSLDDGGCIVLDFLDPERPNLVFTVKVICARVFVVERHMPDDSWTSKVVDLERGRPLDFAEVTKGLDWLMGRVRPNQREVQRADLINKYIDTLTREIDSNERNRLLHGPWI